MKSIVQSCSKSQYHSLTQTVFEMIQFKMPCETYDPLSLISRLNTDVMLNREIGNFSSKLQKLQNCAARIVTFSSYK